MIRLEDVQKRYAGADRPAVDAVSLDVAEGETVALIGPSGCGKSTLLRLMLGLLDPDAGQIHFGDAGTVRERRRRSGYVIQDGGLFPHLTARGNVELRSKLEGLPAAERQSRITELCELTNFPLDGLNRYPVELSGGQRQRVALMRALMPDPPILLLDEPLGALDPMVRADLQRDLKAIFQKLGKTTVLVTHDLAEAAHFADRIVLLRDGQIEQVGTADDLRHRPASEFVSRFMTAQAVLHGEAA